MAKSRQVGLRLAEVDDTDLRRVALREGRSEQEILRDSLRMYVHTADEQNDFYNSVERGWYELRSGLGEIVMDDDDFFESVRRDIRNDKSTS